MDTILVDIGIYSGMAQAMKHYCRLQGYYPIHYGENTYCNREGSSCAYAKNEQKGAVKLFDFHEQQVREYHLPKCINDKLEE